MRLVGIGALALVAIGIVLWLRGGVPDAVRVPREQSSRAALLSDVQVSEHTADVVRGTRSLRGVPGNSSTAGTPSPVAATAPRMVRGEAAPRRAAQSAPDAELPKPAGELFLPFIANDPSQVFAPQTVNFHAAVQSEAIDPAWGPASAAALHDFLTMMFGNRFEIPYVDCRTDLCELQVAGRIGNDLDRDMHDIQHAMGLMKQEPWWTALEFDQESGTVGSSQDGRVILLWFFSRK